MFGQHSGNYSHLPVAKRHAKDTVLESVGVVNRVALATADVFGPLKAALGALQKVYEEYEVRSRPPAQVL